MTNKFINLLFMVGLSAFVVSCATSKTPSTAFSSKSFDAASIDTSNRAQKVDNFIVILDASGSMAQRHKGEQKFVQAKEIVSRLNQTIPDLKLTGALRTLDGKKVGEPYGLKSYSKSELEEALAAQQSGAGSTPIGMAFDNANNDLASSQGQTAIIFVSDGVNTDGAPSAAIASLKKQYGDRLCIYPVRIGQDPTGQAVMQDAARTGQCGFTVNADSIASSQAMANYVERVFLAEKAMPMEAKIGDADGDGVLDNADKCPNVPGKDPFGCPMAPMDSDNDGVVDASDKCPRTPKGAEVNLAGCWVLADVQFDTDRWQIKAKHYGVLERAYRVLAQNPDLTIEIQGHTDNVGTADYNQALSQKRAISVRQYLVEKGIAASRLRASGYGLTQPIDTNTTGNGRARNRRVQLDPLQ
ncbi:MAG: OmpA family protein [Gammaproteobacteria bacterium]|jgi:OOP family OmpA-OmpF porin|nr:OmpA family protein [Gammaproteobacteria bacterium]